MRSRHASVVVGALVLSSALLSGCGGGGGGGGGADGGGTVVSRLGSVPIPSPPAAQPAPVAGVHHPQLLAIGQPVRIELPDAAATVTTFGPVERTPYRGGASVPTSTVGVVTLTVTPTRGTVMLRAADLLSRDEVGRTVALAPVGAATATATADHPATLRVEGTFRSGSAQVTWRYHGHVLAIWDFTIELD